MRSFVGLVALAVLAVGSAAAKKSRKSRDGGAGSGSGSGDAAEQHQYCVIGAGPAGLQLGFFLQQAGRDYVIIEREASAGSFYKTYPRHRQLISINKRYTGHELDLPRECAPVPG